MRRTAALLALAGLAVATVLVAREGARDVLAALGAAGAGVVWASLFHAVPMALNARAWQRVTSGRRPLPWFAWLVWVREAVNGLLPVARVGGEVATARLMTRAGLSGADAAASLVADVTVSLGTLFLFSVGGVALLVRHGGGGALARGAWLALAAALAVLALVAAVQRAGLFSVLGRIARGVSHRFEPLAGSGARLDEALRAMYRERGRIASCAAWQLAGWIAGAGEIWLFLFFVGRPIAVLDAVMIEALVQALSSAAFLVPAALGVQEGAFLALGSAVGLPADVSLALALARRARDILVFVPALVLWQAAEGRWLLRRGDRAPGAAPGRVVVNADDFGKSREVNAAVARAHRDGILTSASLMVTGDAAEEAVALARATPSLAVGLHLALADARPALPPAEVPHLVGADGRLLADPARAGLRWAASAAARRELAREIAAQFERFAATGLPLSHVDGHHHLHLHPAVFPIVVELAARHGARGVRLPSEGLRHLPDASPPVAALEALVLALLAWRGRAALRRRGLAFAPEVHGIVRSGRMDADYVARLVARLGGGGAEIFVHPSTAAEADRGANPADLEALLSPAVRDALSARGLSLATYATLEPA